jgi:hypothetical protein
MPLHPSFVMYLINGVDGWMDGWVPYSYGRSGSTESSSASSPRAPTNVTHDSETHVPRHTIVLLLAFANPALLFIDRKLLH